MNIVFKRGNIFDDKAEAIVNPVNCVGVMGAGLALEFKSRFPDNYNLYRRACLNNELEIGKCFITQCSGNNNPEYIVNFPTKLHYRHLSKLEYIIAGLTDLVIRLKQREVKSVAIPAIGCGLGGLKWELVLEEIIKAFNSTDFIIHIYKPY